MKSSWLKRKPMSVTVLWKKLVGRRTRTRCRFPGKEAWGRNGRNGNNEALCTLIRATHIQGESISENIQSRILNETIVVSFRILGLVSLAKFFFLFS